MGAKEKSWAEEESWDMRAKEENGSKEEKGGERIEWCQRFWHSLTTNKRTDKHHPQNGKYPLSRPRSGFWQTDGRTNPPSPSMASTGQTDRHTHTHIDKHHPNNGKF